MDHFMHGFMEELVKLASQPLEGSPGQQQFPVQKVTTKGPFDPDPSTARRVGPPQPATSPTQMVSEPRQ